MSSELYLQGSRLVDLMTVKVFRATVRSTEPTFDHLLLPTLGNGNTGDQAMLEAFLHNTDGLVAIVVNDFNNLRVPVEQEGRTQVWTIPGLVSGPPVGRMRARRRFLRLLSQARTFSVVGADIMDGSYTRRESVLRSHLLRMAEALAVPSQILGFSWGTQEDPVAASELAKASRHSQCLVRDSLSLSRVVAAGIDSPTAAADMVFTLSDTEPDDALKPWIDQQTEEGRVVVAMNTSGLLSSRMDLDLAYVKIANDLLSRGCAIVVLPHVARLGDDDFLPSQRLTSRLNSPYVFQLESLLSPRQVCWVASRCAFIITGRMHFAVLAATQSTPAITLSTQGKVEGMLDLLGVPELAVEPGPAMSLDIQDLVDKLLSSPDAYRETISTSLQSVRALAHRNFELTSRRR